MDVSQQTWERLSEEGTGRRFAAGETLLRQGELPTYVLLLSSGRVKAVVDLPGGESLLLAVRGPGEVLGIMGVLSASERSATVTAVDPCTTRVLSAEHFRAILRAEEETEVIRLAMLRIREGETWRAEASVLPAPDRVARALLRLAVPIPGRPLEVPLSQSEIGNAVGLSRGAVAVELAKLRDAGTISTGTRKVVITNPGRLR
jgi:CRP/FNR family cyclic AMP-dependent transcriptional regulator